MIAGLITLALVGVLQSLGALVADTVPVEPTWRSDTAAGDDELGQASGRGVSRPDAAGCALIDLSHRGDSSRNAVGVPAAPAAQARSRSHESRAPPALLTHLSV